LQTPLEQSAARPQVLPVPQRKQLVLPPQSMSLSPWFFVLSEQVGT
jgi:hypothetical protein